MPPSSRFHVGLRLVLLAGCCLWGAAGKAATLTNLPGIPPGNFVRLYWYEPGIEHGNPKYDKRFRVNAPETVLHPSFGKRSEARENGMMLIQAEEDLSLLTGAGLYLELWGGHPGTENKRVTINGRSTYKVPEVGTEDKHCTHQYPTLPLKVTDLVNGYNALQFACDQGSTFWGHFIVDNAALCLNLTNPHPALTAAGLADFAAAVKVTPGPAGSDKFCLELMVDDQHRDRIGEVDYQGYYTGYDENGNGRNTDWHGFTKRRQAIAVLGRVMAPPFALDWDTSMLPAQDGVAVRAVVHFKDQTNLVYATAAAIQLTIPERKDRKVALRSAKELPKPFWSRAGRRQECVIPLDIAPEKIERAELHVVTWTGGPGNVKDYFTLNGHPYPVAAGSGHEVVYSRIPISPEQLKRGANQVSLLSDTDHHGIEILLPGPALMIRSRR